LPTLPFVQHWMIHCREYTNNMKVRNKSFESVTKCVCWGMSLTNQNYISANSGSACYHSVQNPCLPCAVKELEDGNVGSDLLTDSSLCGRLKALAPFITDAHSSLSTAFRHHILNFIPCRSLTTSSTHLNLGFC